MPRNTRFNFFGPQFFSFEASGETKRRELVRRQKQGWIFSTLTALTMSLRNMTPQSKDVTQGMCSDLRLPQGSAEMQYLRGPWKAEGIAGVTN